ncbi:hypothetical protein JW911_00285 [Candidatus Peregrinibacteria bacterium]|nr:hypothetical protein [Candidatus Peregrinibacteria bacterium]
MIIKKLKQITKLLILLITSVFLLNIPQVFASSFSSNFTLNDEALNFANSSEHLSGNGASMDLSSIFWTSRIMESASYSVIDSNSALSSGATPPGPGGGGGSVAGGRLVREGEKDSAKLKNLPDIKKPELELHEAPEDIPEVTAPEQQKPLSKILYEDLDGCSLKFENKFMGTNPYDYDSDNDGIGDCDEKLVYGLDPLKYDPTDDYKGIALFNDYYYTEHKPFFVGRADFGKNHNKSINNTQIQIEKMDPLTMIGLFFIEPKKDLNFVKYSEVYLENGEYKSKIIWEGFEQKNADYFKIDDNYEYTELKVDIPENNILYFENSYIKLTGNSGSEYGIVAIWQNENFIDVSAVVTKKNGEFTIYSPRKFEEGNYTVTLYGLIQEKNKIIQTNYREFDFKVENKSAVISEKVYWDTAPLNFAAVDFLNSYSSTENSHSNSNKAAFETNYLLGFTAFISFMLIGFYFLCKQKKSQN